jgi:hypothetical protein
MRGSAWSFHDSAGQWFPGIAFDVASVKLCDGTSSRDLAHTTWSSARGRRRTAPTSKNWLLTSTHGCARLPID